MRTKNGHPPTPLVYEFHALTNPHYLIAVPMMGFEALTHPAGASHPYSSHGAPAATNQHDGQNFPFAVGQITFRTHAILSPGKGRWPSLPNVGMGCGGRGGIMRAMELQGGINSVSGYRTC